MAINQDTTIYGFNKVKEVDNRIEAKSSSFYGFNFPMGENENSPYFELISGRKLYRKNLTQLVRTNPGERFMSPKFGLNLKKYLFEPLTTFLLNDIEAYITETIETYAPYLLVKNIEFQAKGRNTVGSIGDLIIKVNCAVREQQDIILEVNLKV